MKNEEFKKLAHASYPFSVVLMNPPYNNDLHIDFIYKALNIADVVINISPGGFINNIGMYNTKTKYRDVIKHLEKVEFLSSEHANNLFSTGRHGIKSDLHIGVYRLDYTDGKPCIDEKVNNIYKKIRYTCRTNLRQHFINKSLFGPYGVRIYRMHRDENTPYYDNIICKAGSAVEGIDFKTREEKDNFINSIHTWVYEFMFKVGDNNPAHLPYLSDYTKRWTDEMLYELFDITAEDKKIIDDICK